MCDGVEVDVLADHADVCHTEFFIRFDVLVPDQTEFNGCGVLPEVEVVSCFEGDEGVVDGVVGVGGIVSDDVEDGGVCVGGVVDGAVAGVGGAVGCPEDGCEFLVGDGLCVVAACGHALADGLFKEYVKGLWWWKWVFIDGDGLCWCEGYQGGEKK